VTLWISVPETSFVDDFRNFIDHGCTRPRRFLRRSLIGFKTDAEQTVRAAYRSRRSVEQNNERDVRKKKKFIFSSDARLRQMPVAGWREIAYLVVTTYRHARCLYTADNTKSDVPALDWNLTETLPESHKKQQPKTAKTEIGGEEWLRQRRSYTDCKSWETRRVTCRLACPIAESVFADG